MEFVPVPPPVVAESGSWWAPAIGTGTAAAPVSPVADPSCSCVSDVPDAIAAIAIAVSIAVDGGDATVGGVAPAAPPSACTAFGNNAAAATAAASALSAVATASAVAAISSGVKGGDGLRNAPYRHASMTSNTKFLVSQFFVS